MRPNKMALWNEFLPSTGDQPRTTRKSDGQGGMIIKPKDKIHYMYLI